MLSSWMLHASIATLALLAAPAQAQVECVITTDSTFYGQSPPVYPSPNGTGTGNWAGAYDKARALVARLTFDEKVNLTGGTWDPHSGCSGTILAIPRLGFPGLCLSDAGNGVRSTDYVSSWPSGISVGASWNRNLTHARAVGMAGEFRKKGVNIALGPVLGPLGRIATGGRNWEGFSNDPYLSGALAYETVVGFQKAGVMTSTKHFIGYEQETNRNPEGNISAVSSNIDDKTMHEMYLWPFQDAVRAGTGNIMCSYNRVNNSYACANSKLLNGVLKTELGFQGFVVSDWGGQHAGVATALAGLDMTMPSGWPFWGSVLREAVRNGSVPESRLDDMATRILATWYQLRQNEIGAEAFPTPGVGMAPIAVLPHDVVDARDHDTHARTILRQGAVEGYVLVKNTHSALPFSATHPPRKLSVFGYSAKAPATFSPYDGEGWNSGAYSLEPGTNGRTQIAGAGIIVSGGGSGANEPAYISSPFEALRDRARRDGIATIYWDVRDANNSHAPYPAAVDVTSDACLVFGNAYASEGWDRIGLHDDYTDGLVLHVAARCRNTIVVLYNAGLRLVDQFVDHPNVTALLFAHLPGEDAGLALVELLYGDANPSGKLPYTVPRNESQLGPLANATQQPPPDTEYALFPQSDFTEGVFIDYRAFDRVSANGTRNSNGTASMKPRYPFGFGLSYTTFAFGHLEVAPAKMTVTTDGHGPRSANASSAFAPYPTGAVVEGGPSDLWDIVATVTAHVTNTGHRVGAEVAQLYVGIPGGPVRQLRGFEKVQLAPNETAAVTFALTRRDLSTWDVTAQKWLLQKGPYQVYVGSSSRDLPLKGSLSL